LNKKEKDVKNDSPEKVVAKKRGPRSGFLNDMVNNRVKKILSESNIPYKFENGSIIFLDDKNNDEVDEKKDIFDLLENNANIENRNVDFNKSVKDMNIENLSKFYLKILDFVDKKKNDNEDFQKSHKVITFDEMDSLEISTDFHFTDSDELKISEQKLIEYKSELYSNVVHLDFQLLTDFFNYAHTYSPIINPAALVLRIQKRKLSPGLLLAIYALTFLFHPNQNKKLAKFYAEKSRQYLLAHIYASDIQNIHTAYLLSNFEPGTNKSYLLSGISVRLLKVLNLYEESKYIDKILYEERVKTIWCCLGKDALMNITCNYLGHPEWLDQPLPQAATDLSVIQYYTPERLTVVFMAAVICLNKVIQHVRKRRNNIIDKNEFRTLIDELNLIHKNLDRHISLSKKSATTNTHPQLSCIVYHYTMYFTIKLILFNIELSPFIYSNKLLPSKKYIQIKRKAISFSNIVNNYNLINKCDCNNKHTIEGKVTYNSTENIMTPISLSSSTNSCNTNSSNNNNINNNNNNNDNNNNNNNNINNNNNDNSDSSIDFKQHSIIQIENMDSKQISESFNIITANSLSDSVSLERTVDSNLEYEYNNRCVLSKISSPSFNYMLYDDKYMKKENKENVFLEIPKYYDSDIDYESCFNVCYETAEKATNVVNILYQTFKDKSKIKYQNSFCWFFYHIGLFYMNVYANFKKENVKEKIEFYHNQIKAMQKIFPFIAMHYSKLYEEAKIEAYEAFLNDKIIFCPQGYF